MSDVRENLKIVKVQFHEVPMSSQVQTAEKSYISLSLHPVNMFPPMCRYIYLRYKSKKNKIFKCLNF